VDFSVGVILLPRYGKGWNRSRDRAEVGVAVLLHSLSLVQSRCNLVVAFVSRTGIVDSRGIRTELDSRAPICPARLVGLSRLRGLRLIRVLLLEELVVSGLLRLLRLILLLSSRLSRQ
jgi:hypothetical protein